MAARSHLTGNGGRLAAAICGMAPGLVLWVAPFPAAAFEPPYESLNAATVIPARLLEGEDYRINPEVINRGLMDHYRIRSAYGPMTATSDRELRRRLQEIHALRRLAGMNEGLLVAKSVGQTVWKTGESMIEVARDPEGAMEGFGHGIQHLLRRAGWKLRHAYERVRTAMDNEGDTNDGQDSSTLADTALQAGRTFARNRLGVSRAYRNLAREVGVDPYTDNEILRSELDRLAKPAAGASLGTKLVIPPIPSLVGTMEDVSNLVWERDRLDLLLRNKDLLETLPIREGLVERFVNNEAFTPTQQTAIVSAIASMKGVRNRDRLLEYAASAADGTEADFYTNVIGVLSLYHHNRAGLSSIQEGGPAVPVALTRDRRAVVAFPVDRLLWTPEVAGTIARLNTSPARTVEHRELWITGRISRMAAAGLSQYGWTPFTRAGQRLSRPESGDAAPSAGQSALALMSRWPPPAPAHYHVSVPCRSHGDCIDVD